MARHAADFVRTKLSAAEPVNDGRQTPMRGHPVFKAMHATAMCCRGCMAKWWKVAPHRPLTDEQQRKVVGMLLAWIDRQLARPPSPVKVDQTKEANAK